VKEGGNSIIIMGCETNWPSVASKMERVYTKILEMKEARKWILP
jgi:hypothetical protein